MLSHFKISFDVSLFTDSTCTHEPTHSKHIQPIVKRSESLSEKLIVGTQK